MKEFIHHEESDYFDTRKDAKFERKMAKQRDRSKYKKTDQDKLKMREKEAAPLIGNFSKGICTMIRPEQYFISSDGKSYICSLRGALKKEKSKLKNLVIVGDIVQFEETGSDTGVIVAIEPRKSVLSRAEHLSQQKEHLIAANVDQVFITVSVVDPLLRLTVIDRYLIAASKGELHPIILCNKIDLLDDSPMGVDQKAIFDECLKVYPSLGISFLPVSTETGVGIDKLKELMKDRISVFSGQSGTGKSSLINIAAGFDLKVGKTVAATRKGSHTTSFTQLLPLPFGGWCIDTPGIKSFGVWELQEQDVRGYFEEIQTASRGCKFPDCSHQEEPDCAIPKAIDDGKISILRFASYLSLLESVKKEHLRR